MTNAQLRNRYRTRALTETEALPFLEAHGLSAADALAYLTAAPSTTTTGTG